ncbi:MAG: MBL fold metallo-hydrolase [Christensenellaceae bacterium]|nr:MBL fold metallo-hydrolase [Christensenellaceae bacterium]
MHPSRVLIGVRLIIAALAILGAVITVITVSPNETAHPSDVPTNGTEVVYPGLMVYAIDVGQGDCFLLVSPNGKTMLVDSGEAREAEGVMEFLDVHGVDHLDLVVATHPHTDHIGGLSRIISEFETGALMLPEVEYDIKSYNELLETADKRHVECIYVWSGDKITWDESCSIDILSPVEGAEYSKTDMNQWSIIMRVSFLGTSMLFTGDAEAHAEQTAMFYNYREMFDADVLKVAHHGSAYSSSIGFLETVNPSIAIISAGVGNSYGHPDFDTLNKLKLMGVTVYRTDLLGNIAILLDGENVIINEG